MAKFQVGINIALRCDWPAGAVKFIESIEDNDS